MTKIISLYNHKGGVSKTTTTFSLGWTMANLGLRVGIVDLDPQCNLTALVLGLSNTSDFENFYKTKENDNIYDKLSPILCGSNIRIRGVKPTKTKNPNLFLIAGNTKMSTLEVQVTLGLASNLYQPYSKQFVGAINAILRKTAQENKLDVLLLDLSPSSGGLNCIALMGSDYFIVPTSPDFFCYQAIQSLEGMVLDWYEQTKDFRDPSVPNNLPETPPKFLGIVLQEYDRYAKKTACSHQRWGDKIEKASQVLAKQLVDAKPYSLCISEEVFKLANNDCLPFNLINVPDFKSLVAIAQEEAVPIFEVSRGMLNKYNEQGLLRNVQEYTSLFERLATSICKMTNTNKER